MLRSFFNAGMVGIISWNNKMEFHLVLSLKFDWVCTLIKMNSKAVEQCFPKTSPWTLCSHFLARISNNKQTISASINDNTAVFFIDLHHEFMQHYLRLNILQSYQVMLDLPHDFVDVGERQVGLVFRMSVPASIRTAWTCQHRSHDVQLEKIS